MTRQAYAFTFTIDGLAEETFSVVSFKGYEYISRPYRFDIVLAASDPDLDFADVLYKGCCLKVAGAGQPRLFHGVVQLFRHVQRSGKRYVYHVRLAPKLQLLTLRMNSRVFLDKSCITIIEEVLKDAGVAFENRIQSKEAYPKREYVCQFNETDFNFVSRWLEFQGIHYFFEHKTDSEVLVLSNTNLAHVPCREQNAPMVFGPPSGLDHPHREDVVHFFISEHCCLPKSVSFKDYNYELAKPEVTADQQVSADGLGVDYHYGEYFLGQGYEASPAQLLAQQLESSESVYQGKSYCPALRPGTTVTLQGHYRNKYNTTYLLYHVKHEGKDSRYSKQEPGGQERDPAQLYDNTFRALSSEVVFRPAHTTPVPRFTGLLTAVIDASGQGQYAELDAKGRYKVRLPFDSAQKSAGKASHWIRLAEPYAGNAAQDKAFGMHFPLLKGTEVLLSYIEGDIDRPIILSAVYNANNENPVNSGNKALNVVKTKAGNRIVLDDTQGKEAISLALPGNKTMLVMDAEGVTQTTSEKCVKASWSDSIEAKCGSSMDFTAGSSLGAFGGSKAEISIGFTSGVTVGTALEAALGGKVELGETTSWISSEATSSADENVSLQGGMNAAVKAYYKAIKASMITSSVSAVGTGVGSWTAIAGAKEDNLDINRTAAVVAGSIIGSIGAIGQLVGTGFAMGCYLKLKSKKNNSFYTTTMDLGKDGANLTVRSSALHNVGCDIMVVDGQTANPMKSNASVLSIAPKGASITLANKAKAKIVLENGQKISMDLNNGSKKLEMSSSGISMASQGVAAVKITANQLVLQKDNAANIKLGSDGAFIKGDGTGQNYINVTSSGVRMQFVNGQMTSKGMLKASATGMIMLG